MQLKKTPVLLKNLANNNSCPRTTSYRTDTGNHPTVTDLKESTDVHRKQAAESQHSKTTVPV